MPRLLFIGHSFHRRTGSSAFVVEILKRDFDVLVVSFDPSETFDLANFVTGTFAAVCLWQLDYLAPAFTARGMRTVVVPMFDGSSTMPDQHWLQMVDCVLINFSLYLHERVTRLGLRSIYMQYFPDPTGVKAVDDFTTRRLFFWERTPDTFLNVRNIVRIFGHQVDHIHIHSASDDDRKPVNDLAAAAPTLTASQWFETKCSYLAELERANIFVAPRLSEGIGHAFLEAMVRGMVVVAYSLPTHTDYVENWKNGICFNEVNDAVDFGPENDRLASIGCEARRAMEVGYERWLLEKTRLAPLIRSMPAPRPRRRRAEDDAILIAAYRDGVANYGVYLNRLSPLP